MMPAPSQNPGGEQGEMDNEWRLVCVSAALGAKRFVRELLAVIATGNEQAVDEFLIKRTLMAEAMRGGISELALLAASSSGPRVLRTLILSASDESCVRIGLCIDAGSGLYVRVGLGMVLQSGDDDGLWLVGEFGAELAGPAK